MAKILSILGRMDNGKYTDFPIRAEDFKRFKPFTEEELLSTQKEVEKENPKATPSEKYDLVCDKLFGEEIEKSNDYTKWL